MSSVAKAPCTDGVNVRKGSEYARTGPMFSVYNIGDVESAKAVSARLGLTRTDSLDFEWTALILVASHGQVECGTAVLAAGADKRRAEYDE
jgi:hypothetical protein